MVVDTRFKKIIIIFIILFMNDHHAAAVNLEDEDGPISYKIEMLSWEKVNELLPNHSKFTIIDSETGLQFKVQRRAGKMHMDAQPLSRKDTAIMKKIYNGRWSWKRRAIIVLVKDQMIAASMHGMPHGAGSINNGFPGHFCVHFSGSTTHRSGRADLAHELMICKIDEYLNEAEPYELINIFAIAINQTDTKILHAIVSKFGSPNRINKVANNMKYFSVTRYLNRPLKNTKGLLQVDIPVEATYFTMDNRKEAKIIHFIVRRESLTDAWLIDQKNLYKELK
ncbi:hypothetical protein [Bacillus sp. V59.32b]|uniref:hypothetical protein n=1 Tax=Bacillus sp. V59.32b TaxID=1758642 RepID=UPI000E3EC776|nr:hypothetical protein [Bacillus sp. V59.32b]RFU68198.1 hypothetical protein D0463_05420 [Bacillus sp. V59.32b]